MNESEKVLARYLRGAVHALLEDGFFMTADLMRPTGERLAERLRAHFDNVAHFAFPPDRPVDIYLLPEKGPSMRALKELAATTDWELVEWLPCP